MAQCQQAKESYLAHLPDSGTLTDRQKEIEGLKKEITVSKKIPDSGAYIAKLSKRLEFLEEEELEDQRSSKEERARSRHLALKAGESLEVAREKRVYAEKVLHAMTAARVSTSPFGAVASTTRPSTGFTLEQGTVRKLPAEFHGCFPHLVEDEATASADN